MQMSANEEAWFDRTGGPTSLVIDERLWGGLAVLWRAYICAQDTGANVWDLALPTGRLFEAGMTSADLRWLVAKGFAEHGQRTTGDEQAHRSFQRSSDHFITNCSRLILTRSGAALAERLFGETARSPQATLSAFVSVADRIAVRGNTRQTDHDRPGPSLKPHWDGIRRELYVGGLIVKRFRVPARNQETILSVFEEEGWVEHIHDPLPLTLNIDAPTRLHDAINRLNRCQINPVLRFHGDGKGTGVFWGISQPDILV
jgi:hypothetical protein